MLASRIRSLGILFFSLAWLTFDHYRPWVNFHAEALALLGIALLAVSQCVRSHSPGVLSRIALAVLAVAFLPWLQHWAGVGLFAGDALLVCLFLCGFAAAIWLGCGYASTFSRDPKLLTSVFFSLWIVAVLSATIGLLQWFNLQEFLGMYSLQTDAGDRALGNLGQPNQLATLLLIGISTLVWTFENNRVGRFGLAVGVGFLSLVLVLTQSRAGLVSAFVMVGFLVWKNWSAARLAPRYLLLWLALFCLATYSLPYVAELLLMSSGRSMHLGADSARITIWKQMLSGIAQAPWFGYGWNETPTAQAAGSIAVPGSMTFTNAHNVVLDLVAWNGVPLGLLFTGAGVYWFVSRARLLSGTHAVYAMAGLLPIAVHSMVEYPFAYAYFLVTAGFMVGIVEAGHVHAKVISVRTRWIGLGLAAWFVVGGYMVFEYLKVEEDFQVVRFENLKIGKTASDYQPPKIWMLSHMGAMLTASRVQAVPDMDAAALENLRKVSLRFPYGALSLRYAIALGLNGKPEEATHQMKIMRGMYGDYYYSAGVSVLRELQREKYPELAKVITP